MSDPTDPTTAPQVLASLSKDLYQDGVQSSIKVLGDTLSGILKAVTHYPRFWGQISEVSLKHKVSRFEANLKKAVELIPEENRVLPHPRVLGPAIQALEYGVVEDYLSDMFANLIAASMNHETILQAHPAFVEIIKQLAPDEAKILKLLKNQPEQPIYHIHWYNKMTMIEGISEEGGYNILARRQSNLLVESGCEHFTMGPSYLDNLERLGLIEIPGDGYINNVRSYEKLEKDFEEYKEKSGRLDTEGRFEFVKAYVSLTDIGRHFVAVCLRNEF